MTKKRHVMGTVQVTHRCNHDCPFCSVPHSEVDLPYDDIIKSMKNLKEQGCTEVMFTGGEPTLRDDLPKLFSEANKIGFDEICLQTNGTRLKDLSFVKDCLDAATMEKFKIDISYHSCMPDDFNKLSGGKSSLDDFVDGINNVISLNIECVFTVVINSLNYKYLKQMIVFVEEHFPSITHFSFNFMDPQEKAEQNSWVIPRLSEATPFMHLAFRYIIDKGMSFRVEFVPLCFLSGLEEFSSESRREKYDEPYITHFLKEDNGTNAFSEAHVRDNKYVHSPTCSECCLKEVCAGLNPRYAQLYGFDELIPVKSNDNPRHAGSSTNPGHAMIQITNACNLKCEFCSVKNDDVTLPLEDVNKKIDAFAEQGAKIITLSGGEPTLNKDLPSILEYVKQKGFNNVQIQTNGLMLSDENYLKKLTDICPIEFFVSFHSSDKNLYSKITGMKDSDVAFEKAITGLKNISNNLNSELVVSIVISSLNYKQLEEHVKFMHKQYPSISYYNFIFIDPVNKAKENPKTVCRLSSVELHLSNALKYIRANNLNAVVDRMPLCYLVGLEEYSANTKMIITNSSFNHDAIDKKENDFSEGRHCYTTACNVCNLQEICGGLPMNYIEMFGDKELYPRFVNLKNIKERLIGSYNNS